MLADRQSQGLHYALLVSLALHAVVLFAFTDWWEPARRVLHYPTILVARLMEPEPAPPQPAPPVEKEKPAPPKPKVAEAPRKKAPAPEAAVTKAPSVTPAPPAAPAPAPQASEAPTPPAPPVAAARPTPAPAPAAPSADAVEAQTADQYRIELIAAMNRIKDRKRYPRQAFENNWEGVVALGLSIRADGKPSITVKRGSQYDVLDRQAVEVMTEAFREVRVPPALRGKDVVLKDVSVAYELKRERLVRD